ncbi:MAG: hypothetical protein U0X20_22160 [Caldilineaceae bacterium]
MAITAQLRLKTQSAGVLRPPSSPSLPASVAQDAAASRVTMNRLGRHREQPGAAQTGP